MTGKPTARDRLLDAAATLFYKDGVAATGIDAITATAGVAKMSLYNNFESKAALVSAYLDRRFAEWRALRAERLSAATTPAERVMAVFDSYIDHAHLAYGWGFRGCGLLNAAAELPVGDPGRAVVAAQKEEAEALMAGFLAEALPEDPSRVAMLAEHLSYLLEGAMARAGLEGDDRRLASARRIALSLVQDLSGARP